MKLLDKLVWKETVPLFLAGVAIFVGLYFAFGSLLAASRFLARGIPLFIVGQFMLLQVTGIVGIMFPPAMLLAALLGLGRLSGDSEMVALFAGGIGFRRIVRPVLILGAAASVLAYVINDPIASWADRRVVELQQSALHEQGDTLKPFDLPAARADKKLVALAHVDGGYSVRDQTMHSVTVTEFAADGTPAAVIFARRAHPRRDFTNLREWTLEDVTVNYLGPSPAFSHLQTMSTRDLHVDTFNVETDTLAALGLLQTDPNALAFGPLSRVLTDLRRHGYGNNPDVRAAEVTLWSKIALPLACLCLPLAGAAFGLRPPRSSWFAGTLAFVPIFGAYYVLNTVMLSAARGGACPPIVAAFVPDIVAALVGVWLLWRRRA